MEIKELYNEAVALLKSLIAVPSFSKQEKDTADLLEKFFLKKNIPVKRSGNNVWAFNKYYDAAKPSVFLNSHHDTVHPVAGYEKDPFTPLLEKGKLYGLGSNDAGGPLVSLIAAFLYFYNRSDLTCNLIIAATAEEEISGRNGIESILPLIPEIEFGIVGEPTLTELAIAQKGLLVLDCRAVGRAGHAAREEGENAIYNAMADLGWFRDYRFPRLSDTLGEVKMSVTSVETENKSHNIIPDSCSFVVDIRVTDVYTHEEVLNTISSNTRCIITPRSMRLRSSGINADHRIVEAGIKAGKHIYGSPTLSDASLMPFPVLKCGPGDSARSHTADEFIYVEEINEGIRLYIHLLSETIINKKEDDGR